MKLDPDMQREKQKSGQGPAAAAAPARDLAMIEHQLGTAGTPDQFCSALSKILRVRQDEVALLQLENNLLRFLFPDELKTAGSIPLSSTSAIAAHTATTRKVELFNNFAKIKHASIFETVRLGNKEEGEQERPATIQKLMSAPVLGDHGKVLGVIQTCRKGFDVASSGPDFTLDDLQQLELAARIAGKARFMQGS
jgi:hypothetical protein